MLRNSMILAMTLIAGCGTINEKMQPWVGQHQDELISAWGPPSNTAMLSDGRQSLGCDAMVHVGRFSQQIRLES